MSNFYKNVGKQIEKYRKNRRLSAEELANRIGVTKKTIRRYELGEIRITHSRMEEIAVALDIDVNLLYGEMSDAEIVELPHYGQVSCGNGVVHFDPPTEKIETPKSWINGADYFYLTAEGDSMVGAKIDEGDLLLIRKQDIVENNEIAVVVIDDEVFLKRFIKDGDMIILQSENSKYPPKIYNPQMDKNIRIIGKLRRAIKLF